MYSSKCASLAFRQIEARPTGDSMNTPVSLKTLGELSGKASIPSYDPRSITPGIVHFGVGNFHRAHQAVYLDELFSLGDGHDFGVIGAGVRPSDDAMRQRLAQQDWLTTVVEQDADRTQARIVGSMIGHLPVGGGTPTIIDRLSDPGIRIVSMTITEGGYFISPSTQQFDASHPDIEGDAQHPDDPKTVFGLILAGLKRRYDHGKSAFTVLSCDNIVGNGNAARRALVGLARLGDQKFADWVENRVAFPNSMVDRITPATSDQRREQLARERGIEDRSPVFCENFRQWVIEDHFSAGRPALERVGVQFVKDVSPYEVMKIRVLNAGHATLCYPAALLGIQFVHDAMNHSLVRGFLDKFERVEVAPVVPDVDGMTASRYYDIVSQRFGNPYIADTIERICFDGSSRQPTFILPLIRDRLAQGAPATGLALVSALWCRYCYGEADDGGVIGPNDPYWARLNAVAQEARKRPMAWLEMETTYGDLRFNSRFASTFGEQLTGLFERGVGVTLTDYLRSSS